MASFTCDDCSKTFSTSSNLSRHKKGSKKCVSIAGIKMTYDCEFCFKELVSSQKLKEHLNICVSKKLKEKELDYDKILKEKDLECAQILKDKEIEYNDKLKEKDIEYAQGLKKVVIDHREMCLNYEKTITGLRNELIETKAVLRVSKENSEKQSQQIQNLQDRLERIVSKSIEKSTTTTNITATTNNNTAVNFFTQEYITNQVNSKFDRDLLIQGIQGVAKFTYEHISKEGDRPAYVCTDPSRQVFNYMSADGKVTRDYKGMKLIKILQKPIKDRSFKLIKDAEYAIDYLKDVEKRDENENKELSLYRFAIERWGEICIDMTSLDKSSFISELTKLVTV
jgi:hypothetical protein